MDAATYLNYFATFGIASLIVTTWILWTLSSWQKTADTHIQVEVIPRAGKKMTVLGTVVGPMLKVEENKKKGIPGREWPIAELATHEGDYPHDWPIKFMRRNIKEMIVWSYNWEPISNPDPDPLMSPELIYTFEQERVSSTLVAVQQWLSDQQDKILAGLQNTVKAKYVYTGLFLIGAMVAGLLFFLYPALEGLQQLPDIIDKLNKILGAF